MVGGEGEEWWVGGCKVSNILKKILPGSMYQMKHNVNISTKDHTMKLGHVNRFKHLLCSQFGLSGSMLFMYKISRFMEF